MNTSITFIIKSDNQIIIDFFIKYLGYDYKIIVFKDWYNENYKDNHPTINHQNTNIYFLDINLLKNNKINCNEGKYYFILTSYENMMNNKNNYINEFFIDYCILPLDKSIIEKKINIYIKSKQTILQKTPIDSQMQMTNIILQNFQEHRKFLAEYINFINNIDMIQNLKNTNQDKLSKIQTAKNMHLISLEIMEKLLKLIWNKDFNKAFYINLIEYFQREIKKNDIDLCLSFEQNNIVNSNVTIILYLFYILINESKINIQSTYSFSIENIIETTYIIFNQSFFNIFNNKALILQEFIQFFKVEDVEIIQQLQNKRNLKNNPIYCFSVHYK